MTSGLSVADIVLATLYGLLFLFIIFVTFVVISKDSKQDKILLAMLISLQLAAISRLSGYIILTMDGEGKITDE